MNVSRRSSSFAAIFLSFFLLLTACTTTAPSPYDTVQEETTGAQSTQAIDRQAEAGGSFNKFFPDSQGGYEVVPSQEKDGFAEYKLKQDGKTLAMLAISDTISLPAAAAKYNDAASEIAGFPAVNQGTTATGILVADRYQVKVLSRDPEFTQADREIWLERFNLRGLAQLQ